LDDDIVLVTELDEALDVGRVVHVGIVLEL